MNKISLKVIISCHSDISMSTIKINTNQFLCRLPQCNIDSARYTSGGGRKYVKYKSVISMYSISQNKFRSISRYPFIIVENHIDFEVGYISCIIVN